MRRSSLAITAMLATCAVLVLTTLADQPAKQASAVAPAGVWEYKSFQRTVYTGGLDTQMNELGGQGWEFCGAHSTTMAPDDVPTPTTVYVFRRAKVAGGK